MALFELAFPCFNCKADQWRLGTRSKDRTEFICVVCGAARYAEISREQFNFLVGGD